MDLPDNMIYEIFRQLDYRDGSRFAQTCSLMNKIWKNNNKKIITLKSDNLYHLIEGYYKVYSLVKRIYIWGLRDVFYIMIGDKGRQTGILTYGGPGHYWFNERKINIIFKNMEIFIEFFYIDVHERFHFIVKINGQTGYNIQWGFVSNGLRVGFDQHKKDIARAHEVLTIVNDKMGPNRCIEDALKLTQMWGGGARMLNNPFFAQFWAILAHFPELNSGAILVNVSPNFRHYFHYFRASRF